MTNLSGKRVLVTGAGGFIGSHLTEFLVEAGAEVRALCKYNGRGDLGKLAHLPPAKRAEIDLRSGDIRDPFFVDRMVAGCDVVFHLAALIGIPYSYAAPADYVATNVNGTLNILEACRRHKVGRLLQTSTSEVYGSAVETPMTETHRLHPQSPYAASKVASDALALSYFRSFDTPVVVVRPFNTYGPRQSTRAVIPTILRQLIDAQQLQLGSVNPLRDFTFVTDTVRGFIELSTCDQALGETVNLGTGECVSIGDVAQLCMKVVQRNVEIACDDQRVRPAKSEVDRLQADIQKIQRLSSWKPQVDLESGLKRTLEDLQNEHADRRTGYSI